LQNGGGESGLILEPFGHRRSAFSGGYFCQLAMENLVGADVCKD
jgi:hypothetical protein